MKPLNGLIIATLAISALLAIIALFLNIAAPVGLNAQQKSEFAALRAQNLNQLNQSEIVLAELANVTELIVDTTSVPAMMQCEQYVSDGNPALMNASAARLAELLIFNETLDDKLSVLLPGLESASNELDALSTSLQSTGIITTHQTGVVSGNMAIEFDYSIKSLTLADEQLYYIDIPKSPELIMVMNNVSDVTLDAWLPSIGSGYTSDRVDSIMDRQQEKVMSVPYPIMFQSRTYTNGTEITLRGNTVLSVGDYIGIADSLHISF